MQGIGLAITCKLLASGAKVATWDTDSAEMSRAKAELAAGDGLVTAACDQSRWADVEAAVAATSVIS